MYIVAIGWLYVAMMMSVAEATNTTGSVVGAIFTFLLYGLLPVALVLYLMGTPGRKRALRARQEAERSAWVAQQEERKQQAQAPAAPGAASGAPDAGGEAATGAVTPVRKEP